MATTIGTFTAKDDRSYAGSLRTLTINQRVTIVPNGRRRTASPTIASSPAPSRSARPGSGTASARVKSTCR